MFSASNISPVTTPPPRTDRVMQYSRHSKENLRRQSAPEIESPVDTEAVFSVLQDDIQRQSTPNTNPHREVGGADPPVSPRTSAKLRLDRVVTEQAEAVAGHDSSKDGAEVSRFEGDRELEFENEETESSATESSSSVLTEENR